MPPSSTSEDPSQFQYYAYGGPYTSSSSPQTFSTPGSAYFPNYFTSLRVRRQVDLHFDGAVTWDPSSTSLNSNGLYIANGPLLTALSGIPAFRSVMLDPSSHLGSSGFKASDITWNATKIAVDWQGQTFAVGDTVVIDVTSVPEPSTWALMGLGVAGLVAARGRARRAHRSAPGEGGRGSGLQFIPSAAR